MDNKDNKYRNKDGSVNWGKAIPMVIGVGLISGILYILISQFI